MRKEVFLAIVVMAGVTYLIRVLPLILLRKPIKNQIFKSFLYYVPYVTLSVMTNRNTKSSIRCDWFSYCSCIGLSKSIFDSGCSFCLCCSISCRIDDFIKNSQFYTGSSLILRVILICGIPSSRNSSEHCTNP